jgi:hypothetical protein
VPAITLRSLRSDLAYKLDQLEVRAAVLERDVRNSMPVDLPPRTEPFGRRVASTVSVIVGAAVRLVRASFAWIVRAIRSPSLAFALRVVRGCLNDALMCAAFASVAVLVWVLALLIMAPPE